MSWLDSYRPASFRGVAFRVDSHDAKFGRRQATHEFAERDEPFTEDLGRKAREFSVEALLIGDDYPAQRDQLIEACERGGAGELVHPYLGSKQVHCTGLTVREAVSDLRMCRLQISFIEAGAANAPAQVDDPVQGVTRAANDVTATSVSAFPGRFTTKGAPSFVVDAAAGTVTDLSARLSELAANPLGEVQAVAGFVRQVAALGADALRLVTQPAMLAGEIVGLVGSIRSVFGTKADTALRGLRDAYRLPPVGVTGTPSRQRQRTNADALAALVRRAALAELAKVTVIRADETARGNGSPLFQTREDAVAARDALTDAIDMEIEGPATGTEEFRALDLLRAEIVRGVPPPGLRLPSLARFTPAATLPSLVVAYQFYGTAARAVEIAERNRSRHPGFLPGGEALQVISDG